MEPKVISPTSSEGWKLFILLHNSKYITLVSHKSLMLYDSPKLVSCDSFYSLFPFFYIKDFEKFSLLRKLQIFPSP